MKTGVGLLAHEHRGLAVFFVAYYLLLTAYGTATGASQTIFYAIFVLSAAAVVAFLYANARLSALVLWGLGLWGLSHMVGGIVELGGVTVYERPSVRTSSGSTRPFTSSGSASPRLPRTNSFDREETAQRRQTLSPSRLHSSDWVSAL